MCGLLYSRLSKRELAVDWTDPTYSEDGSNVFRKLFRCSALFECDDFGSVGDSVYPSIWPGHLEESAQAMADRHRFDPDDARRELSIDVRRLDYDAQVVVLTGLPDEIEVLKQRYQGLLPELDRLERPQLMAKLLAEQLVPCPEVRRRVDNFKDAYFGRRTIGMHVRFSDKRIRLLPMLRQLNELLKQESDLQVFVATDNEAILRLIQRHYSNVIAAPHWYDQRGAALHYSQSNGDRMEGAIDALTDLYLLADCDYLIVDTTSSFSLLASVLSKAGPGRIRVVRPGAVGLGFLGSKGRRKARRAIARLMLRTGALTWGIRAFAAVAPIRRL
jgi:hypothetical protein